MRASPPIEVRLHHDARWGGFVLAVLASSCAVVATWIVTAEADAALKAAVAVAALIALGAAFPLALRSERTLRWTGQRWQLTDAGRERGRAQDGEVSVALDLGSWMLLRFTASGTGSSVVTWLPVRRRGLEAGWHGLRCALYAWRPLPPTP
jgi:hypothetical protein